MTTKARKAKTPSIITMEGTGAYKGISIRVSKENEDIVSWLLESLKFYNVKMKLAITEQDGILEFDYDHFKASEKFLALGQCAERLSVERSRR